MEAVGTRKRILRSLVEIVFEDSELARACNSGPARRDRLGPDGGHHPAPASWPDVGRPPPGSTCGTLRPRGAACSQRGLLHSAGVLPAITAYLVVRPRDDPPDTLYYGTLNEHAVRADRRRDPLPLTPPPDPPRSLADREALTRLRPPTRSHRMKSCLRATHSKNSSTPLARIPQADLARRTGLSTKHVTRSSRAVPSSHPRLPSCWSGPSESRPRCGTRWRGRLAHPRQPDPEP